MQAKEIGKRLVDIASRGKSLGEIAEALQMPEAKAQAYLANAKLPDGYLLTHWHNQVGKMIFQVVPPPVVPEPPPPKAFHFERAKHPTPYMRVFIPDDVKDEFGKPAKYIEFFGFSDVHWGHTQCDTNAHNHDLKQLLRKPHRYAFLNGDNVDNSHGDSAKGVAWMEQYITPEEQRKQMVKVYRPAARKIVSATRGNHEARSKLVGWDPMEYITDHLDIQYFKGPYLLDIVWQGNTWSNHIMHGSGNSNTAGGKANSANRVRRFNSFKNIIWSDHVHHSSTTRMAYDLPHREYDDDGNLLRFSKVRQVSYTVILPAYLKYDDTYASEWALAPGSRNEVFARLYRNGDCHIVMRQRSTEKEDRNAVISESTL